jgi:ribosomal protein S18 acetylase RimI-like enzyme
MVAEVRRALPHDAPAIAAVHVHTWQAAYRGLVPDQLLDALSVTQREDVWRQVLAGDDGTRVYVAIGEGRVVGFCAVAAPSRDEDAEEGVAEIGAIYVHPDVWRSGVGRALMDVAIGDLQEDGWRWVTLWVFAENQQARDFYARLGFEPDEAEMTHAPSGGAEIRLRRPIPACSEVSHLGGHDTTR